MLVVSGQGRPEVANLHTQVAAIPIVFAVKCKGVWQSVCCSSDAPALLVCIGLSPYILLFLMVHKHGLIRHATREHEHTISSRAFTIAILCRHSADAPLLQT